MASIMFDGSISATIAVRGKSYTLVGSGNVSALTAGGSATAQLPSVKLVYHAPFSDAISLGTLDSQLDGASSLMQDIIAALHLPAALDGEIATLRTQLKALPGPLGQAYTAVLDQIELRITDIELTMDAPAAGETTYKNGKVSLGFGFDCSRTGASLLGIRLQAIGLKFSVAVSI